LSFPVQVSPQRLFARLPSTQIAIVAIFVMPPCVHDDALVRGRFVASRRRHRRKSATASKLCSGASRSRQARKLRGRSAARSSRFAIELPESAYRADGSRRAHCVTTNSARRRNDAPLAGGSSPTNGASQVDAIAETLTAPYRRSAAEGRRERSAAVRFRSRRAERCARRSLPPACLRVTVGARTVRRHAGAGGAAAPLGEHPDVTCRFPNRQKSVRPPKVTGRTAKSDAPAPKRPCPPIVPSAPPRSAEPPLVHSHRGA